MILQKDCYWRTSTGTFLEDVQKMKPIVYEDEWLAIREIAGIFKFLFVTFQTNFTPNHSMQGAWRSSTVLKCERISISRQEITQPSWLSVW